jgi:hypothetical protein
MAGPDEAEMFAHGTVESSGRVLGKQPVFLILATVGAFVAGGTLHYTLAQSGQLQADGFQVKSALPDGLLAEAQATISQQIAPDGLLAEAQATISQQIATISRYFITEEGLQGTIAHQEGEIERLRAKVAELLAQNGQPQEMLPLALAAFGGALGGAFLTQAFHRMRTRRNRRGWDAWAEWLGGLKTRLQVRVLGLMLLRY